MERFPSITFSLLSGGPLAHSRAPRAVHRLPQKILKFQYQGWAWTYIFGVAFATCDSGLTSGARPEEPEAKPAAVSAVCLAVGSRDQLGSGSLGFAVCRFPTPFRPLDHSDPKLQKNGAWGLPRPSSRGAPPILTQTSAIHPPAKRGSPHKL